MKFRTVEDAKAAKRKAVAHAKQIADRVEGAGRGFTPAEHAQVQALVDEARAAAKQAAELEGDDQLRAQLTGWGSPVGAGMFGGGNYRGSGLNVAGRLSLKALGAAVGRKAVLESGSTLVPTPVVGDLHREGERPQLLAELLPVAPVAGDRFRFLRQTARVSNAAPVARGAQKPESVFTVESVDERTRTVAHVSEPIPRQDLDDSQALGSFLSAELRYGTLVALDDLIVTGDGVGENFEGLLETNGIGVTPFEGDLLGTARRAKTNLQVLHVTPTHWLLSPADWETIETTRDGSGGTAGTGGYLLGDPGGSGGSFLPVDSARQKLWGVDVVVSTAVPEGTGILLDVQDTVLVMREQVRIDMSENVSDDYVKNLVRLRSELRGVLAVLRPAGVMAVELVAGS